MDELERYGQPYFKCRDCEYGSMIRSNVEAHIRDHEPRPTLDEMLAEPSAPEEAPEPAPTRRRRS